MRMRKLLKPLSLIISLALLSGVIPGVSDLTVHAATGAWTRTNVRVIKTEDIPQTTTSGYKYTYTNDGEMIIDGEKCVRFTKTGGWMWDKQCHATFQTYCTVPPETIQPGSIVTLTIGLNTVTYVGDTLGIEENCGAKIEASGLGYGTTYGHATKFVNSKGETGIRAVLSEHSYGGVDKFTAKMKENPTVGEKISIYFSSWAGQYEWEYEYKEVSEPVVVKAPGKVKLKTVSSKKKKLTAKWNKLSKNCTGYEIQIAQKKNFKNPVIARTNTTNYTFKKLKKGKRYYVRVRGYNESEDEVVCGPWSNVKNIKIK
jgi:hypothetical protein